MSGPRGAMRFVRRPVLVASLLCFGMMSYIYSKAAGREETVTLLHVAPFAAQIMRDSVERLNSYPDQLKRMNRGMNTEQAPLEHPRRTAISRNERSAEEMARLASRAKRDQQHELTAKQNADQLLSSYNSIVGDSIDRYMQTSQNIDKQAHKRLRNAEKAKISAKEVDPFADEAKIWKAAGLSEDNIFGVPGSPSERIQRGSEVHPSPSLSSDVGQGSTSQSVAHSDDAESDADTVLPTAADATQIVAAEAVPVAAEAVPLSSSDDEVSAAKPEVEDVQNQQAAAVAQAYAQPTAQSAPKPSLENIRELSRKYMRVQQPQKPREQSQGESSQDVPMDPAAVRELARRYLKEDEESQRAAAVPPAAARSQPQPSRSAPRSVRKSGEPPGSRGREAAREAAREEEEKRQVQDLKRQITWLQAQLPAPAPAARPPAPRLPAAAARRGPQPPHRALQRLQQGDIYPKVRPPPQSYVRVCNGFGCHLNPVAGGGASAAPYTASAAPPRPAPPAAGGNRTAAEVAAGLDAEGGSLEKIVMPWDGAFESEVYLDGHGRIRSRHGDPRGVLERGGAGGGGAGADLFGDSIVAAAPGFNDGVGRHARAQEAADWERNWGTRRHRLRGVFVG